MEYKAAPFRVKSFLPTSTRLSRVNHCVLVKRQVSANVPGLQFWGARWSWGVLSWALIAASGSVTQNSRAC